MFRLEIRSVGIELYRRQPDDLVPVDYLPGCASSNVHTGGIYTGI